MLLIACVPFKISGAVHRGVPPIRVVEKDDNINAWESEAVDRPKSAKHAQYASLIRMLIYGQIIH